MTIPKVSVLCITYNHARFIRDALDGFVMQKTNFPFEVLIHDDASTDGTADIIREYTEKYPDIIKPILQTENQWSRGVDFIGTFLCPKIRGQYVCLNEGDDYWTDPYKLQKQVDFMDAHTDYSVCFHPVRVVWDNGTHPDSIFPSKKHRFNKTTLELSDLLKHNFIQTNSVMYRWRHDCVSLRPIGILPGDWYLHLLHAQVGKIGFISDIMSVYRRNDGGIWTGAYETDKWFRKCTMPVLNFYKNAQKQFSHDFGTAMADVASGGICAHLRAGDFQSVVDIYEKHPDVWTAATAQLNNKNYSGVYKKYRRYKRLFNISVYSLLFVLLLWLIWGVL